MAKKKKKIAPSLFERLTALDNSLSAHRDEDTVEGEMAWIASYIVAGGEDEMSSVDGIQDLLFDYEHHEFGTNENLAKAAVRIYPLIFPKK